MMWRLILAFIQAADNSSRFLQCCPPRMEGQVHNNNNIMHVARRFLQWLQVPTTVL